MSFGLLAHDEHKTHIAASAAAKAKFFKSFIFSPHTLIISYGKESFH